MKPPRRLWPSALGSAAGPGAFREAFGALFAAHGEMPHQHPQVLWARIRHAPTKSAVYTWPADEPRCVIALRSSGSRWQSLFPGAPILAAAGLDPDEFVQVLGQVAGDLGTDCLYFPLAYPDYVASATLAATPGIATWPRSPSPIIDWADRGQGIPARFRERLGSRADRKARRWKSSLHSISLTGAAARGALAEIERHSWKAAVRLDLASEGQLEYYRQLLDQRLVTMSVALLHDRPIAYRLDARHRDVLYALEWSYDARFGTYAPGMFLLADDLQRRWGDASLEHVDLFGSPDTLKVLLATGVRGRLDFAWPSGPVVDRLRAERQAHDARLDRQLADGVGIRRTYAPDAGSS